MAKTWVIAILLAIVSVSFAQDFTVTIGKDASAPAFDPAYLSNYTDGSSVEFAIYGSVHVVESTFEQPCFPKADGYTFSTSTSAAPTQYNIQITTFEGNGQPLWFSDTSRCAAGMVFAINPTTQQTYDQFKANAMKGGVTSTTSSSKALSATSFSQTPSSTVTPKSSSSSALTTNVVTGAILLMQLLICWGP